MAKLIRAEDFYNLAECDRRVYLEHHGDPAVRAPLSDFQAWVYRQGRQFEQQVTSTLKLTRPRYPVDDLEAGAAQTLEMMRQGAEIIYQGVLLHEDLVGIPDLLVREPGRSLWGDYYYRPADIKSASSAQRAHRLQVMAYISLLEAIQGRRPVGNLLLRVPVAERGSARLFHEEAVVLEPDAFAEALAHVRMLAGGEEPRPFLASVCHSCAWHNLCRPLAEESRDVSLIPGLQRRVWSALHARGLGTLNALAAASPESLLDIRGVGDLTARSLVVRARALHSGDAQRIGNPDLPASQPVIFFDVESVPPEGLYYLMGTLIRVDDETHFTYELAASAEDELRMWESFLARLQATPGPVIHYGNYERTVIQQLDRRYGPNPQAARLLERLVNLQTVLEQTVVLPLSSYSLKQVAPLIGYAWREDPLGGEDSMLAYLAWLEDGNRSHLENILRYNEDDCRATAYIYDWLMTLPPA